MPKLIGNDIAQIYAEKNINKKKCPYLTFKSYRPCT